MKNLCSIEQYRLRDDEIAFFGVNGDEHNGIFRVFVNGKSFKVIASNGGGWEHVSVSRKDRCPTWNEMCAIKDMFFSEDEVVMQLHPAKKDYVNIHSHCLHLWRPINGQIIPIPPVWMV